MENNGDIPLVHAVPVAEGPPLVHAVPAPEPEPQSDELLCGIGGESTVLGAQELREAVKVALDKLGPKEKVLIIPPVRDGCRSNAHAAAFLPW
jgi:hypothetical protein